MPVAHARYWVAGAAALAALTGSLKAQTSDSASSTAVAPTLRLTRVLTPAGAADKARRWPLVLQAQEVQGRPDLDISAQGDVELRRGSLSIRADEVAYDVVEGVAHAHGQVQIDNDGNRYSGPELRLKLDRFEGYFLEPTYYFGRMRAGGHAQRIDFLGEQRALATAATYSSCPSDGSGGPAWLLSAQQVRLNLDDNEGVAEGAVLRFLGVPILAAPHLSFPLTEERKSGWLPPLIGVDSRSGFQMAVPWYWNMAANRDATFTPTFSARRGAGANAEFRYLEPLFSGAMRLDALPNDRTLGRSRYALVMQHDAELPHETTVAARVLKVSDNAYWKDFPRDLPTLTPRLLLSDVQTSRPLGEWTGYARALRWQVLQNTDSVIDTPYERMPQIGARTSQPLGAGFEAAAEIEFNRFTNPAGTPLLADGSPRLTASRQHMVASLSRPWSRPGWRLTPQLTFNAASYALDAPLPDGRRHFARLVPTLSVDSAWVLERETSWFGRAMRQTLEPRILYVNTPFHAQPATLNFDSATKEFNFESLFSENAFSGIDRVQDAHQVTMGAVTRLLDPISGAETLRLGMAQRYLLRDQLITPDGQPLKQRFSDVLLLGSSTLVPRWTLDAAVQYNPDSSRIVRSVVSTRYSPGPYRTVSAAYRLARGLSEQLELGWQWPIAGPLPILNAPAAAPRGECHGTWYGVGRINYSLRDTRVNDSLFGLEYDAGCWIGRIVAERLSTGRSEATTRLLFQLELVGLSRLGSNPLQVLKDNISGYRLLREAASPALTTTP